MREHGATEEEIDFLLGNDDGETKRVELNAMPSDVFIAFLEGKLTEAGVEKVVPDDAVLEQHARRLFAQKFAAEALKKAQPGAMPSGPDEVCPTTTRADRRVLADGRNLWDQAAHGARLGLSGRGRTGFVTARPVFPTLLGPGGGP